MLTPPIPARPQPLSKDPLPTRIPTYREASSFRQGFFNDLIERQSLVSLYDFENRKGLFPAVHRSYKFCLLTLSGTEHPVPTADYAFFNHEIGDIDDPDRRFSLSTADFALLNPNTRTTPIFRREPRRQHHQSHLSPRSRPNQRGRPEKQSVGRGVSTHVHDEHRFAPVPNPIPTRKRRLDASRQPVRPR